MLFIKQSSRAALTIIAMILVAFACCTYLFFDTVYNFASYISTKDFILLIILSILPFVYFRINLPVIGREAFGRGALSVAQPEDEIAWHQRRYKYPLVEFIKMFAILLGMLAAFLTCVVCVIQIGIFFGYWPQTLKSTSVIVTG